MKYNIGDKVLIKDRFWYINGAPITCRQSGYCGTVMTIEKVKKDHYKMKEDDGWFDWTDVMIEGLAEEETLTKLTGKAIKNNEMVVSIDEYILPEGYIFKDENGNVINATKIVLEKKNKEYPKTYEECCKVLGLNSEITDSELLFYYPLKCGDYTTIRLPEMEKFEKLIQLYLCRNAYWKIAGEEMGLGKPWEPNDSDYMTERYCIFVHRGNIICDTPAQDCILTFPTAEMRDAFYKNFKKEIEECKELL